MSNLLKSSDQPVNSYLSDHDRAYYHTRRQQRGLTLLEALVVLVLIGILAQVSLPWAKQFTATTNTKNTMQQLSMDLRYARNQAIVYRQSTYLLTSDSGWQIFTDSNTNGVDDSDRLLRDGTLGDAQTLASDSYDNNAPLTFSASGRVASAGSIFITTTPCTARQSWELRINTFGQVIQTEGVCP